MLIKRPPDIKSSEITPEKHFVNRRSFIRASSLAGAGALIGSACSDGPDQAAHAATAPAADAELVPNPLSDITSYNNFYEFGLDKSDPATYSKDFKPKPWSVTIDGEADVTGTFDFDDIVGPQTIEERIYRLRCVEAWSMIVPWNGFALGDLLKRFKPNSRAKYVAFETVVRPSEMPGQRRGVLDWPYVEGLRIDEAMHPLAILAVGMYGRVLPNQNGAPLRLVVPWKYGFKSIKSIVKIQLTREQPKTSWNLSAPREYGFYSNVNPEVDHPRWSQSRERRIGEFRKRKTLPFNGYAEQVAGLYAGMDLRANF